MASWWMDENVEDMETRRLTIHGSGGLHQREAFRRELVAILTVKDPARLPDVEHLVHKYEGLEDEFIEALKVKHDWDGAMDEPTPDPHGQERKRADTVHLADETGTKPLRQNVPQVRSDCVCCAASRFTHERAARTCAIHFPDQQLFEDTWKRWSAGAFGR